MSDDPNPDAPEPQADPDDTPPDAPKDDAKPAPPWGTDDEFNPEKAWKLIQDLRKDKERLKPLADKAKELEDASKTEGERLAEQAAEAASRAEAAERRALLAEARAERPSLTPAQVARLQGDTVDELLADAEELYGPIESQATPKPTRRPTERLTPGAVPGAAPEPSDDDLDAVVARARRF